MTKSYCVGVCEYEENDTGSHSRNEEKTCRGCGRTASEITEWFYATEERKREIVKTIKDRRKTKREANGQG